METKAIDQQIKETGFPIDSRTLPSNLAHIYFRDEDDKNYEFIASFDDSDESGYLTQNLVLKKASEEVKGDPFTEDDVPNMYVGLLLKVGMRYYLEDDKTAAANSLALELLICVAYLPIE